MKTEKPSSLHTRIHLLYSQKTKGKIILTMVLCHAHSPWFSTASAAQPSLPGCPCPPLAGLRAGPDRPPTRRAGAAAPSGQGSRAGTAGCDAHTARAQFSDQRDGRSLRPQRACRSEGPGGRRQGRSPRGQRSARPRLVQPPAVGRWPQPPLPLAGPDHAAGPAGARRARGSGPAPPPAAVPPLPPL